MLRFENLSTHGCSGGGMDGGGDWIGRALSVEIAGQLESTRHHAVLSLGTLRRRDAAFGSRPLIAPGVSAERTAALAGGANRLLTGFYICREDQLSITAFEENPEARSVTVKRRASGTVEDLLHLSDQIAREVDDEAAPPITGSARALRSYALGVDTTGEAARLSFEEAVGLDPDFGLPYLGLARMALAKQDKESFEKVFASVRARGSGVRVLDRVLLNVEDARMGASPATLIDALGAAARLLPADPIRLEALAETELAAKRYPEAADHYRRLLVLLPGEAGPAKRLACALSEIGDVAGAAKAMEEYRTRAANAGLETRKKGGAPCDPSDLEAR